MSDRPSLPPPPDFLERARALEIDFDPGDVERLGRFLAMLLDTNRRFNLTAISEPDLAWSRHVLDSLTLLPYLVSVEARTAIDVGSGGGLPGMVLATAWPDLQVTLLEATGKKAGFLREVVAELRLPNVKVIKDRAETIGHDRANHRERYDVVTARAVGPLAVLLELTVPLARVGGLILSIKGEKAKDEIEEARAALAMLRATVLRVDRTESGTIVVIEKLAPTPRIYPRRPGEPKRAPLGLGKKC